MSGALRFDLRALAQRLNRQLWRRACAAYGEAVLARRRQLEAFADKRGVDDEGRLLLPHDEAVIEAVDATSAEGGMATLLLVPLLTLAALERRELDGITPPALSGRGRDHRRFFERALGTEAPELASSLARALRRGAEGEVSSEHLHAAIWWADASTSLGAEAASFIVADALLELSVAAVDHAVEGGADEEEVVRRLFGSGRLAGLDYVGEVGGGRLVEAYLLGVSLFAIDVAESHYVGDLVHYLQRNVVVAEEALRLGSRLALESFELDDRRLRAAVLGLATGSEDRAEEVRQAVEHHDPALEDHDLAAVAATCWRCAAEGRWADASDVAELVARQGLPTYDLTRVPGDVEVGPILSSLATLMAWFGSETGLAGPELLGRLRPGLR